MNVTAKIVTCISFELTEELEDYRLEFELLHGPTSVTDSYTSSLSASEQSHLLRNEPGAYWNGLPPYVRSFLRERIEGSAREGNLDSLSDAWIRAYISGHLRNP